MVSNILYKLYWRLTVNKWQIGFPQASLEDFVRGGGNIELLKGVPEDRWFADPFIIDVTSSHITLLVEEFLYCSGKGRIARLTVSRKDYTLERNDTLLELDTHLSFPTIVRRNGKILICPENSASGKFLTYEYDAQKGSCILCGTMYDAPLVDAVLEELNGKEYLFATQKPNPNGRILQVYERDESGSFRHKQNVCFADNIGRNAGAFFKIGEELYRPAQDCNGGYGRGLSIQRVTNHDGRFEFSETTRIRSPRGYLDFGMHTLNRYKDVTVIDVASYRWPKIGSLTDYMWQKFKLPTSIS